MEAGNLGGPVAMFYCMMEIPPPLINAASQRLERLEVTEGIKEWGLFLGWYDRAQTCRKVVASGQPIQSKNQSVMTKWGKATR